MPQRIALRWVSWVRAKLLLIVPIVLLCITFAYGLTPEQVKNYVKTHTTLNEPLYTPFCAVSGECLGSLRIDLTDIPEGQCPINVNPKQNMVVKYYIKHNMELITLPDAEFRFRALKNNGEMTQWFTWQGIPDTINLCNYDFLYTLVIWHRTEEYAGITIDWIKTLWGNEFTEFADWSPTILAFHEANGSYFQEITNDTQTFHVNFTDSNSKSLEYRIENFAGSVIVGWTHIDNRTWFDLDGDCDVAAECDPYDVQFVNQVYNITNWRLPPDWDTDDYNGDCEVDHQVNAAHNPDDDAWVSIQNPTCWGRAIFDISNLDWLSDGDYNVQVISTSYVNLSFDGTQYDEVSTGGSWTAFPQNATITNSNFSLWMSGDTYYSTQNLGGIMFYRTADWTNLSFTLTLSDHLTTDGVYVLRLRAINRTIDGINTSVTLNFTYDDVDFATITCDDADIDNTHWQYNITKHFSADPLLSMSGCVKNTQWQNSTWYNNTWNATTNDWYNETNNEIEEFYGTHRVRFYCNDSQNIWVLCATDVYSVLEGGTGLNSTQNTWLSGAFVALENFSIVGGVVLIAFVFAYLTASINRKEHPALVLLFLVMTELFVFVSFALVNEQYATTLTSLSVSVSVIVIMVTMLYIMLKLLYMALMAWRGDKGLEGGM